MLYNSTSAWRSPIHTWPDNSNRFSVKCFDSLGRVRAGWDKHWADAIRIKEHWKAGVWVGQSLNSPLHCEIPHIVQNRLEAIRDCQQECVPAWLIESDQLIPLGADQNWSMTLTALINKYVSHLLTLSRTGRGRNITFSIILFDINYFVSSESTKQAHTLMWK